jgi:hypothetical protein
MRRTGGGSSAVGDYVYAGYAMSDLRSGNLQAKGTTGLSSRPKGIYKLFQNQRPKAPMKTGKVS